MATLDHDGGRNAVAEDIFEAFYADLVSDRYKCYGPGETDHFFVEHSKSGKTFKIQVMESDK